MRSDRRTPNQPAPRLREIVSPIFWLSDRDCNEAWPWFDWFWRNPCANFMKVGIGVADRWRTVFYSASPWTYADSGLNYGYTVCDGDLPCMLLPFVSYRGSHVECMVGWKTSGAFGVQCRRANSPNADEKP